MADDREFERPADLRHTSGPADLARVLGWPSTVGPRARKEGRVVIPAVVPLGVIP